MRYVTTIAGREYTVEVLDDRHVIVDGRTFEIDFDSINDQPVFSLLLDGKSYEAFVYPNEEDEWQVLLQGRLFPALVVDEREKRMRSSSAGGAAEATEIPLKAPMPGLVISVLVDEGQEVEKGQVLIILESMKMQNELRAPRRGVINRLKVHAGEGVEQKQTLLSIL